MSSAEAPAGVRIITRAEADKAMETVLKPFPFPLRVPRASSACAEAVRRAPLHLRARMIVFDSDLLFFGYPREILEWAREEKRGELVQRRRGGGSLVGAAEAKEELGVTLWPRVNSGLCLLHKPAIDFEFLRPCARGDGDPPRPHLARRADALRALRLAQKRGRPAPAEATKFPSANTARPTRWRGITSARCAIVSMARAWSGWRGCCCRNEAKCRDERAPRRSRP